MLNSASGIVFSSGNISSSSVYNSGLIASIYPSDSQNIALRETVISAQTYNRGFVSVVIQAPTKNAWNFYLEAVNTTSPSLKYITYTASGTTTNQYNMYKEVLELRAGLSDVSSFTTPGYVWARDVSGYYITPKIPVYFRKIG